MTAELPVLAPGPAEFAFACNRCGNCCSNGTGYVWLEPHEIPSLAEALGSDPEAFARRHVRSVGGRLSLVEESGRCSLLRGKNECAAYEARPAHCATFPFWPGVLQGGDAFERARGVCPGIHEAPPRPVREAAYAALEALYVRVDAEVARHRPLCVLSGDCCDFPTAGHTLFATLLETDLAAERGPAPAAEREDWCAFYQGRRCSAREVRPLACRTYFCDASTTDRLAALHEESLAEIREIERRFGYPAGYGSFVELLPVRRESMRLLDERRALAETVR